MTVALSFTDEEAALVADAQFFRKKERISAKVRAQLDATYVGLAEELRQISLIVPPGFNPRAHQFVKGEQLESFPYQYLDYPKYFDGPNKFTFRTLFWWGHHVACALILEGEGIKQYKKHVVDRFHQVAGQELELSLPRRCGSGSGGKAIRCRSHTIARRRLRRCWPSGGS